MTTATKTEPDHQTAAVESASDRPARDLLSQATALRTEWDATNQHDQREGEDASVAAYLKLLRHKGESKKGDAVDLAHAMVDLEISPEQAMQDREIMEQALVLQDQRAQRAEAHQLAVSTREEWKDLEKRHEVEEHDAFMKKETAWGHHDQCCRADHELLLLKRQRPLLFTKPGEAGLVRLVGTDPVE